VHVIWIKNRGLPKQAFDGRPVIAICNTFSEFTPCNAHFRGLIEHIRRGAIVAGSTPVELSVFSCGETLLHCDEVWHSRCMDTEEAHPRQPDGRRDPHVRMLQDNVMGAANCDLPTLLVSVRPMLNGGFTGRRQNGDF
jgi:L-arabonate dehydrase